MLVDISPLVTALIGAAATTVGVTAPVFAIWLASHFKDKAAREIVQGAIMRAAAVAVDTAQKEARTIGPVEVHTNSAGMAAGLAYMNATLPDALKRVTPEVVTTMIGAEAIKQQAAVPAIAATVKAP